MTELMWKNEEDRLQIIKNLSNEFNSRLEGCFTVNLGVILQDYLPWIISHVEKLEKEILTGQKQIYNNKYKKHHDKK